MNLYARCALTGAVCITACELGHWSFRADAPKGLLVTNTIIYEDRRIWLNISATLGGKVVDIEQNNMILRSNEALYEGLADYANQVLLCMNINNYYYK